MKGNIKLAAKPKTNQPETPNENQTRDNFFTPNYGVDILLSFIPKNVKSILEPAAGNGKIVKYLSSKNYNVIGRDINREYQYPIVNFLTDVENNISQFDMIITNPPFT